MWSHFSMKNLDHHAQAGPIREPNTFLTLGHQQMRQSSIGVIRKRRSGPHLTVENVLESRTLVHCNVGDRRKEPAAEDQLKTERQSSREQRPEECVRKRKREVAQHCGFAQ